MSLILLALNMKGQSVIPPYSSTMYGEESGWTTVNIDEDTKTWVDDDYSSDFSDTPYAEGKEFKDRRKQADDWLISPAITLTAGKEYKVSFWLYVESGYDNLSLSWADAGTVEALSAEDGMLFDYEEGTYDWERYSVVVTPENNGSYYFGFHVYSPESKGYVYLTGFEVAENVFTPASVGNLNVAPDLNGALRATLSWTLPITDADGIALPSDATFDKIKICRDGDRIADLPGDALTFEDSEALGLTEGKHTYSVTVTVNGVDSREAEITSRHIGPLPVCTLPWSVDFGSLSKEDFYTYYAVIKGENSTVPSDKGWVLAYDCIEFRPGSSVNREDDWLLLPKMKFDNPGVYRLRYSAEYDSRNNPAIAIYKGSERSVASMSDRLSTIESIPAYEDESSNAFRIEEPGEYYLALYAGREKAGDSSVISFYEMTVEECAEIPDAVTDLKLETSGSSVILTFTAPSRMNTGISISSFDRIGIYRDGELLEDLRDGLVPGETVSYTDNSVGNGVYTYSVIPVAGGNTPEGAPMTVSTPWMGDKLQKLPYTLDFSGDVNLDVQKALWTVLDNNGDSYTWSVKSAGFTLTFDYWDVCDDMLLSPPFEIEPDNYTVNVTVKGGEEDFPIHIGLVAENDATYSLVDAETIILDGRNVFADRSVNIKTQTSGRHHLALHTTAEYGYDPYNVVVGKIYMTSDKITGVSEVVEDSISQGEFYDLNGLRIDSPRPGTICILRSTDGSVRKIVTR